MIYGSLKNIHVMAQYNLLPLYDLMVQAINLDKGNNTGRIELVKGLVFANFDEGCTEVASARKYEYHKDFLDVHIILNGCERIGYRSELLNDSDICEEFSEEKDLGFLVDIPSCEHITLNAGDYAVFAPLELHQPLCAVNAPVAIRKIVLKVHADYLKSMR